MLVPGADADDADDVDDVDDEGDDDNGEDVDLAFSAAAADEAAVIRCCASVAFASVSAPCAVAFFH